MPGADSEVSALRTILNSSLFKVAWRTALVIGGFVLTGAGAYISANTTAVRADVDLLRIDVQEISASQSKVVDLTEDLKVVRQELSTLSADTAAVKLDTATIKGILQEMRRRDVASDTSPWPYAN